MQELELRIHLIDEISKFHPSSDTGRKTGFSHYVGGMADTGDWYKWKMLKEATIEQLQKCLADLQEEFKPRPAPVYTEEELQDMNTWVQVGNITMTVFAQKQFQQMYTKMENEMLWGKR